jgi:hypothetical protein
MMNVLFAKYKEGRLEDGRIEEMHRQLTWAFFNERDTMDIEEREYSEDLVLELMARGELDEEFAMKCREWVKGDRRLGRKLYLYKNLQDSAHHRKEERAKQAASQGVTDEQEEEDLRVVLEQVLEKAHAEEESETSPAWTDSMAARTKSFLHSLIAPLFVLQPQDDRQLAPAYVFKPRVKMALVLVSLTGFFTYATWYTIIKVPQKFTADKIKEIKKTGSGLDKADTTKALQEPDIFNVEEQKVIPQDFIAQNEQNAPFEDKVKRSEPLPELAQTESEKEDSRILLASMYAPPEFEYLLSRGEISDAARLFILAADKYNGEYVRQDYDSCIIILNNLLEQNAFGDKDTINEMQYFLGHSYMALGIKQNSESYLLEALRSFGKIDRKDRYYDDAKEYSLLVNTILGQPESGLEINNFPDKMNFLETGIVGFKEENSKPNICSKPILSLLFEEPDIKSMTRKERRELFIDYWFINLNIGGMMQNTDVVTNKYIPPLSDWRLGFGGSFGYQFHPIWGVRAGIIYGELYGESKQDVFWMNKLDPVYDNGLFFRARLFEYKADFTINFSNLISGYNPGRFLDVYGIAGLGITEWTSTGYYFDDESTTILRYEDGKDVRGEDGLLTPDYKGYHKGFLEGWNRKTEINWGLGCAFHIIPQFEANIEFQIKNLTGGKSTYIDSQGNENTFHQGDFLDNMENGEAMIFNDMYSYISLGFTYKFGK